MQLQRQLPLLDEVIDISRSKTWRHPRVLGVGIADHSLASSTLIVETTTEEGVKWNVPVIWSQLSKVLSKGPRASWDYFGLPSKDHALMKKTAKKVALLLRENKSDNYFSFEHFLIRNATPTEKSITTIVTVNDLHNKICKVPVDWIPGTDPAELDAEKPGIVLKLYKLNWKDLGLDNHHGHLCEEIRRIGVREHKRLLRLEGTFDPFTVELPRAFS
jgi:hypothetical protein